MFGLPAAYLRARKSKAFVARKLSGTFRTVVKHKSTQEFRWLPYVTTLLCTSLWTFYGFLKPGGFLIITVNGAGAVLQAVYVALYLAYAPRDVKMKMAKVVLAVNVCFYATVVLVGLLALHGAVRLFAVGMICSALTIGMYAAPMAAMVSTATFSKSFVEKSHAR
ncbi:hypothetical protein ACQ4PT_038687 [Festuca glaucescens]